MPDLAPGESITFTRINTVPGVEMLEAYNAGSQWAWFATTYGVAMPVTWSGEVFHERRTYPVGNGAIFCGTPGDTFHIARATAEGSFKNLMFDPQTLNEHLAEHDIYGNPQLRRVHTMSPELAQRLSQFYEAFSSGSTAMHLQTSVTELVAVMAGELVVAQAKRPRLVEPHARAAERLRECLHEEDVPELDLDTLARKVGMTRFKVLRVFKRQFGLTPHKYQLCLRISRAHDLLRQGQSCAEVAAYCGFADQSHFIRHFKRQRGVTPGQYVHAQRA